MSIERQGNWFLSFTGKRIYPYDMRVEDICIQDIAHSLALTNRFNGHSRWPYSVAQHSVLMSQLIRTYQFPEGDDRQIRFQALMHDAPEAYCGDMISPIKSMIPRYKDLEAHIWEVVAQRFNLPLVLHPDVKDADMRMVQTERRDLLIYDPTTWESCANYASYWRRIVPWPWDQAEAAFLERFEELTRHA